MRVTALVSSVSVLIVLSLLACGPAPQEPAAEGAAKEVPPEALEKARQAADALTGDLVETLGRELEAGGAVGAVKVCAEMAPRIAASHSGNGVTVRRVTLKVRNPQDTPDEYERGVLEDLEAKLADGALPSEVAEVVTDDAGSRLRYLRPLVIKSTCLNCHGDIESMEPELRSILEERYPDDQAVGYREGDLRGAVSVTVDLG
jgi:hypothetical protein